MNASITASIKIKYRHLMFRRVKDFKCLEQFSDRLSSYSEDILRGIVIPNMNLLISLFIFFIYFNPSYILLSLLHVSNCCSLYYPHHCGFWYYFNFRPYLPLLNGHTLLSTIRNIRDSCRSNTFSIFI